jgi:hypothetical protein
MRSIAGAEYIANLRQCRVDDSGSESGQNPLRGGYFVVANLEECGLVLCVFSQFFHFVYRALGLLVFTLNSALGFIALLLLPRLFLLALMES